MYNQERLAARVMNGIIQNMSANVKELIILFDGCIDTTEEIVKGIVGNTCKIPTKFLYAGNVNEVIANNLTFRAASYPYIMTVQDDCQILEKDFDKRMLKPFLQVSDLLGVTGRNAQNEKIVDETIHCFDVFGKDVDSPRNTLGIRDIIVRTPILFDHQKLETLDYLDEEFAPIDCDDKDIGFRAYKKKGWLVGAYVINYDSPASWGKTRNNPVSHDIWVASTTKNVKIIIERYRDLLEGKKHNLNIIIKE